MSLLSSHLVMSQWPCPQPTQVRCHHLRHLTTITHSSISYQYRYRWLHGSHLPGCPNSRCHSWHALSLNKHAGLLSKACYYHIRGLGHIRKSLTDDSAKSIACTIAGSRLEYANAAFVGVSVFNIEKLQQVQNTLMSIVTHQYGYIQIPCNLPLALN